MQELKKQILYINKYFKRTALKEKEKKKKYIYIYAEQEGFLDMQITRACMNIYEGESLEGQS